MVKSIGGNMVESGIQENRSNRDRRGLPEKRRAIRRKKIRRMIASLIVVIAVAAGIALLFKARPDLLRKVRGMIRSVKRTADR